MVYFLHWGANGRITLALDQPTRLGHEQTHDRVSAAIDCLPDISTCAASGTVLVRVGLA
jgi:hypothetical protein